MSEGIVELTAENFDAQTRTGVVLVDFWAPWCNPCRMQGPILEKVAAQVGAAARVAKVNVDEHQEPAARYGVRGIPTLILFKDGQSIKQFVGVQQEKTLVDAIRAVAG